jgi:hypothetical protein
MKTETIKAIFTNLLFVIGVVLLIVGASRGVLTVARLAVFDEYPLDYYAESRCNITPAYPEDEGEVMPKTNTDCDDNLDYERKIKLTEDIVNSITLIISGATLVFAFKRFILK